MNLTDHLAACVRQSPNAQAALRQAVHTDESMRTAAHARLAEITAGPSPIRDKCHIARVQESVLKEVLGV